ncbi:MAG TPA: hypothetical protein VFA13_02635 [Candidatus Acidoferrum sp.]|jgi:hypothetical protein|nr:hypothetical protein [Candidatus Acidoferrum sp.]
MAIRIEADEEQPSATVEIPLTKPLPDYDLEQIEQPTPRDVDGILVSQGFRDLIDDGRGVLTELLSKTDLQITQFTGAICPGDDEVYRPGVWIIVRDAKAPLKSKLSERSLETVRTSVRHLVERLGLE